jgi:ankyrin repeat protein
VIASDAEDGMDPTEKTPKIPDGLNLWLGGQSSSAIALRGERGSGKSLLSRTVYRKLRALPDASVAYFCFTETDARQSTVTAFLASVILQILSHDRDRFPRVQDLLRALEERYAWTETGLFSLFQSLMDTRHGLRPVHLVIDGLHRCSNWSSCKDLLKTLLSLVGNEDTLTPLKIVLSYQDHAEIQELVKTFAGAQLQIFQLDQGGFSAPMHELVPQEVASLLVDKRYLLPMKKQISDALAQCNNPFEVALAAETIALKKKGAVKPCTRMVLERRITQHPRMSVSDAASARLKRLPNWARTALGWIYYTRRPLSLEELSLAVAVTDETGSFSSPLDTKRLPMNLSETLIVEFGPFLSAKRGAVVFRNDNVRRFFSQAMKEEAKKSTLPPKSPANRRMDASNRKGVIPTHSHIANILMRYISSPEFVRLFKKTADKAKYSDKTDKIGDLDELELLALAEYAVRFLPVHYNMVTADVSPLHHIDNISEVQMWQRLTLTFNPSVSPPSITVLSSVYLLAAQLGLTSVITYLESSSAPGDIPDSDRTLAVTVATWSCHQDTVDALLAKIPKTPESGAGLVQALQYAVWRGYRSITKKLLERMKESGFDASSDLRELVCQVAELGYKEDIALLLKTGKVEIDAAHDGQTPLQYAARNGHAGLAKYLLDEWGADVDAKAGVEHPTPIQLAAERGHERVIQHLLAKNATTAELDQAPRSHHTPLYLAAANGHDEVVRLLLQDRAAKKELTDNKESPLIIACAKGHLSIAYRLIKAKINLHQPDNQGKSALYYAVRSKNEELALKIVRAAKDTLGGFKDIGDIFLLAAETGLVEVVRKCVEVVRECVDGEEEVFVTGYRDDKGCTALHQAAKHGHDEVVSLLLERGVNPNPKNEERVTPIVMAAVAGEIEVVNTLLRHGATVRGRVGPELDYTPLTFVVAMCKDTKRHADALYELARAIKIQTNWTTSHGLHYTGPRCKRPSTWSRLFCGLPKLIPMPLGNMAGMLCTISPIPTQTRVRKLQRFYLTPG